MGLWRTSNDGCGSNPRYVCSMRLWIQQHVLDMDDVSIDRIEPLVSSALLCLTFIVPLSLFLSSHRHHHYHYRRHHFPFTAFEPIRNTDTNTNTTECLPAPTKPAKREATYHVVTDVSESTGSILEVAVMPEVSITTESCSISITLVTSERLVCVNSMFCGTAATHRLSTLTSSSV